MRIFAVFVILVIISACTTQQGRYKQQHDSTPARKPTQSELHDPIPRVESPSRGGNKHYTVWGKDYKVLKHAKNFTQTGLASWYGKKFHGHLTSNGEIYDMYSMSAAHKNLPLPTYAKITNLSNQKTVIVRVNDRGPFHQSRIIDLSYSAAYKLDMLKTGTAKVHVEAITEENIHAILQSTSVENPTTTKKALDKRNGVSQRVQAEKSATLALFEQKIAAENISDLSNSNSEPFTKNGQIRNDQIKDSQLKSNKQEQKLDYFVQVLATKNIDNARRISNELASTLSHDVNYPYSDGIFRIFIGPIPSNVSQNDLLSQLDGLGYPKAYIKRNIR